MSKLKLTDISIGLLTGYVVAFFSAITAWELLVTGSSRELIIGTWISAFTGFIGYYIGSSKGSERKTELLARAPPIVEEHKEGSDD